MEPTPPSPTNKNIYNIYIYKLNRTKLLGVFVFLKVYFGLSYFSIILS